MLLWLRFESKQESVSSRNGIGDDHIAVRMTVFLTFFDFGPSGVVEERAAAAQQKKDAKVEKICNRLILKVCADVRSLYLCAVQLFSVKLTVLGVSRFGQVQKKTKKKQKR